MTKARFYIKGKPLQGLRVSPSSKPFQGFRGCGRSPRCGGTGGARDGAEPHMVQDVGYRPYIMKEVIKREGLNGIADNYSQALTFEQLGKGIPILKEIYRSIEGTNENIKGMSAHIEGMDENIKEMNENIKGMDEKLDKLPERIAKELKEVLKHFLSKERTCAKKG